MLSVFSKAEEAGRGLGRGNGFEVNGFEVNQAFADSERPAAGRSLASSPSSYNEPANPPAAPSVAYAQRSVSNPSQSLQSPGRSIVSNGPHSGMKKVTAPKQAVGKVPARTVSNNTSSGLARPRW